VIYLLSAALGAGVAFLWFLGRRAAAPSAALCFERRLDLPRLPPDYDGLRVLHISDPHLTPRSDASDAIIARAEAARPDLVAVTGDLASGWRGLPLARHLLKRLASRWPTYVVAGNADHSADLLRREVARWGETGARVLMNEGRPLRDGDAAFWIAGVDDPYRFRDDPARALAPAPAEAFKLLLAHSPEVIERREALGADLILSGHTHGGQVRLPRVGALVTRTRLGRRFSRGVFRLNGATLVVTSGIGATRLGVRFWCPPEMTLWVLRRGSG
jgi:predicted MPP superfamily phosphohydrolase